MVLSSVTYNSLLHGVANPSQYLSPSLLFCKELKDQKLSLSSQKVNRIIIICSCMVSVLVHLSVYFNVINYYAFDVRLDINIPTIRHPCITIILSYCTQNPAKLPLLKL